MEEREQASPPIKHPFKRKVSFSTSLDKDRQIPTEMKEICEDLLHQAIGRVLLSKPDASTESKELLLSTSDKVMQALDKAFQLEVLDPNKLEEHEKDQMQSLWEMKRKRKDLEQCIEKGKRLYEELQRQYERKSGQEPSEGSSVVIVEDDDHL